MSMLVRKTNIQKTWSYWLVFLTVMSMSIHFSNNRRYCLFCISTLFTCVSIYYLLINKKCFFLSDSNEAVQNYEWRKVCIVGCLQHSITGIVFSQIMCPICIIIYYFNHPNSNLFFIFFDKMIIDNFLTFIFIFFNLNNFQNNRPKIKRNK